MRVQQGLTFDEISTRLQRSPGALRVQFHRCVGRARDEIHRLSSVAARRPEVD